MKNRERNDNIYPLTPGIEVKELPIDEVITTEGGVEDGTTIIKDPRTGKKEVVFHKKVV